MNTNTIATSLITDTTATIKRNRSVEYPYSNQKGLSNSYSVLGLIVSIETTRKRGYTSYETWLKVAYKGHWGAPDTFTDWFKNYRLQFNKNVANTYFLINREFVERHTATRLQDTHDIGVVAGELHVLTVINKYIELLFAEVDKEVITRQINELQSQLATLA